MPHLPPDFAAWLDRARGGSAEHAGLILESYRAYLAELARREYPARLLSKSGVSDLVQEAMLEAYRTFPTFRGGTEAEVRAWLRQVMLYRMGNVVRRYDRTLKRGAAAEVPLDAAGGPAADDPSPSRGASAREQAGLVRAALDRLPDDYRAVLLLRQQEQLPFDEIGRRLGGRTGHAARLLWLRALRRLRDEVGGDDGA